MSDFPLNDDQNSVRVATRWFLALMLTMGVLGTMQREAWAHARTYVWTQEYQTLPQGAFEVESHTQVKVPDMGRHSGENTWKYEEELEYGVTDRLNIAHYEAWNTGNHAGVDDDGVAKKDTTKYGGFKFETKYSLGEKGKYWVDPLIYLEYEYEPQERFEGAPHVLEGKVVLSKDFGKLNVAYNQIMESKLGHKGRTEHEYSLGANYELVEGVHAGLEVVGQYWNPSVNKNEIALGPTLAYESKYFWIAAGVLIGANQVADNFQGRVSVGIPIG